MPFGPKRAESPRYGPSRRASSPSVAFVARRSHLSRESLGSTWRSPDTLTVFTMSTSHTQAQIDLHRVLAPRYAYRYGFEFSRLFQQDWHAELISHVPAGATDLLDLGCGTGFFLAELADDYPKSVGLDISHDMLKVSEQYVPGARLITGDAERLPFQPGVFDVVFCKGSLHHARDHARFLANCRAALADDGVLIMSEPCNDNPLIRWSRAILYRNSEHFDEGDLGFTKRGIVELCERAGFDVTVRRRYGFLAYILAGFPDHIGVLKYVPGRSWITRFLIRIDRVICAIPGLSVLGFQIVIVGKPRVAGQ